MSEFGHWIERDDLPAFRFAPEGPIPPWDSRGAGPSTRCVHMIGNRRLQAFVDDRGTTSLFDESEGLRWVCAPTPDGTGFSRVRETHGSWGTEALGTGKAPGTVTFGPTWFEVDVVRHGARLTRTLILPEGEVPWVLVRVELEAPADRSLTGELCECWRLRPRFLNAGVAQALSPAEEADLAATALECVAFETSISPGRIDARERRRKDGLSHVDTPADGVAGVRRRADGSSDVPTTFGTPWQLVLATDETGALAASDGDPHPLLELCVPFALAPGARRRFWFRFGHAGPDDWAIRAEEIAAQSRSATLQRLARADSTELPEAAREVPWHHAVLTGAACHDLVLGGHSLNQGSVYALGMGANAAARDPLQHALPLIYLEPDLALSVIRNSLSWGGPDGRLPWCLDGAKQPRRGASLGLVSLFDQASDLGLWALWAASEYVIATGDRAALRASLDYHPSHEAPPRPLYDHLVGLFRHLRDNVGRGANGHLRVLDCDWADGSVGELGRFGLSRADIVERGESVLNSAMAAWVLPIFAAVATSEGDGQTAQEAATLAAELRAAVAGEWNGRWFRRARCDDVALGDDILFLEQQPWALLCGAASDEQARILLGVIDDKLRAGSPLGARQRWPLPTEEFVSGRPGEALSGGIWFSLQAILIWAAARYDRAFAVDEWRRISLANHTRTYPAVWEGTLSGPDAYNAPESATPGRTWALSRLSVQMFPTGNLHAHAQPLFAYLRLLGIEPDTDGALRIGSGMGDLKSRLVDLLADGSGKIRPLGETTVRPSSGQAFTAGSGEASWRAFQS